MNESIEYKGYKITIENDPDYMDTPLDWTTPEERGATFALKHNRYELPFELDPKYNDDGDDIVDLALYNSWTEFAEACAPEDQKCYKFVRWYEHSGIAVSLRDDESGRDWDAGIAGVIFGRTTEDIENAFSDWKPFVEGDLWSVFVTDQDGEQIDSLSGIAGYDQAELEGQYIVDYQLTLPPKPTKHDRLRTILIDSGAPEYGDAIIDEISDLFGYRRTKGGDE